MATALQADLPVGPADVAAPDGVAAGQQRLYALDALRAVAMLLGLVLHAAIPFMRGDVAGAIPFMQDTLRFWPVADRAVHPSFDWLVYLIHAFRMPAFFVMAGFFAHLLFRRRGSRRFTEQRVQRIGLPFVAAVLVLIPIGYVVWTYGWRLRAAAGLTFTESVGRPVSELAPSPMHLWFLEYLLIMYAATVVVVVIVGRLWGGRFGPALDRRARPLIASPWAAVILAAATLPPMLRMDEWTSDTPHSFIPSYHLVAFYGLFYLFGWLLYAQQDLLGRIAARSGWHLAAGLLVLPLLTFVLGPAAQAAAGQDRLLLEFLGRAAFSLLGWLLTLGVIGLFLRCFDRPSPTMQYLSDAAYWTYLVHLPLVALFNILVADWDLPGAVKMWGVVLASSGLLLLSYQLAVRHTIVGRILNGPRSK
jgi:peptidoglycan/LPS O-acetylase OafA/YrhL